LQLLVCASIVLGVALFLGAVGHARAQEPDARPIADFPDQAAEWAASPHGNTYGLGKGPNTYCSRCHSPQNWDPASMPAPPPNCITCKFPQDPEVRNAPTMAFVEEADWVGIPCATCHRVEGDTIVTTSNAWLNPIAKEYVPMATSNQLCGMCHTNSTGVSETGGRGVDHEIILGGSAHRNWAATIGDRRPDQCVDCHNPHTQQPMACVDCHTDVADVGVHPLHAEQVTCIACHDASGAQVGPNPVEASGGAWTTILVSVGRGGDTTVAPIVSHSVQWDVACDRCHFVDNPTGLPVLDASGAPVQ